MCSPRTPLAWFAYFTLLFLLQMLALHLHAQKAAGFQPTRFTVEVKGTPGKPDVLLLPGRTSGREVWSAEAAKLAPNFRLHLVQIDGFAGQPAGANASGDLLPAIIAELHGYIAAHGLHPVVIGHSLGGLLSLMLAQKYPADVSKLVIVDALPFYGMMFGPQMTAAMLQPQAAQMRDMLAAQDAAARQASARKTAEMLVLSTDGRRLVAAESQASDVRVLAEAMYEDLQTDLRGELASMKAPTLMLYPVDPSLPIAPATVDDLYTGAYKPMPNAKVVRIEGSRHFIMLDQPEKLDAAIEAFLK